MTYEVIRNKPAAKFLYKGTHSHPIRRTILITEDMDDMYVGYEIRSGNDVRDEDVAPIKSYRKDRIKDAVERMSKRELEKVGA